MGRFFYARRLAASTCQNLWLTLVFLLVETWEPIFLWALVLPC